MFNPLPLPEGNIWEDILLAVEKMKSYVIPFFSNIVDYICNRKVSSILSEYPLFDILLPEFIGNMTLLEFGFSSFVYVALFAFVYKLVSGLWRG